EVPKGPGWSGGRAADLARIGALLLCCVPLLAGCNHRRATATGLPVLFVPTDAPTEEPPPAPLSVPQEVADKAGKTDKAQKPEKTDKVETAEKTDQVDPSNKTDKIAKSEKLAGDNEIPCSMAAPEGMVCIPGGPFWRGNNDAKADEKPRMRIVISPFYM